MESVQLTTLPETRADTETPIADYDKPYVWADSTQDNSEGAKLLQEFRAEHKMGPTPTEVVYNTRE